MSRVCLKCGQNKPLTAEYFHRESRNKCGFKGVCKECFNAWYRQYIKIHKIEISGKRKTRYHKDPTECLARRKKYYDANHELINKKRRDDRLANPEKELLKRRKRYAKNREFYVQSIGMICTIRYNEDNLFTRLSKKKKSPVG